MYYLNDTLITINNILRFMSVFIKIYIYLCHFAKKMVVNRVHICENRVQINIDVYISILYYGMYYLYDYVNDTPLTINN